MYLPRAAETRRELSCTRAAGVSLALLLAARCAGVVVSGGAARSVVLADAG